MSLVIVESPSKCKKIEDFLGKGVKCLASCGHVRQLKGLDNIDVQKNYTPTFHSLSNTHIKALKYALNNAKEVYIATDDDREGEAIGWHLCQLFKLPIKTTKRIKFSEITKPAVLHAYQHPTILDMDLVNAAIARQVLDLLVGFTISPFLWRQIHRKKHLSAGRCQTPALRLVYDNQQDIDANPGDIVHQITGYFTAQNIPFKLSKSLQDPNNFLEESVNFAHRLKRSLPTSSKRTPPLPFSTSRLQQVASTRLHLSPKVTMMQCQKLYEEGHITYMRTDSQSYSKEFLEKGKEYITERWAANYVHRKVSSLEQQDTNAHEAIRPTNIKVETVNIDNRQSSLYRLIWETTCASMMSEAEFSVIRLNITAPMKLVYKHVEENPVFLGWMILTYKHPANLWDYVQRLKEGNIAYNKIKTQVEIENRTLHYGEAKLVNILEKKGIGRPSTFASLVEKIKDRKYVKKTDVAGKKITTIEYELEGEEIAEIEVIKEIGGEKNKLVIEPLGIMVVEFLIKQFDCLFKYEYTGHMEEELDKIAKGKKVWHTLCGETHGLIKKLSAKIEEEKINYKIDEVHTYMIGKYGPTVKWEKDGVVVFKKVNEGIDYKRLQQGEYTLEDIIDRTTDTTIGIYKKAPINVKKGPYGYYIQHNKIRKSIDGKTITLEEAIKLLERPSTIIHILRDDLSIRTGKYGLYIFYKTKKMTRPKFYKLDGYDMEQYDKAGLLKWIKEKYKV